MPTNIRTTTSVAFKADDARLEKQDRGLAIPIAQCDEKICAAWANDVDEKLEQINEAFVDGLPVAALTIGDGSAEAVVTIDKATTVHGAIEFQDQGTLRWRIRHATTEDLYVDRYDSSGVLQDSVVALQSSGRWTFPDDVSANGALEAGDGTGNGVLRLDGDLAAGEAAVNYRSDGVNNWITRREASNRNFVLNRRDASGDNVDNPMTAEFSTGNVLFPKAISIGGGLLADAHSYADDVSIGKFSEQFQGLTIMSSASGWLVFSDSSGGAPGYLRYHHTYKNMYMSIESMPRFEWNETAYRPVNGNWDLGGSSNRWATGWFLNAVCVANGAAANASSSADDLVVGDGTGSRGISVYSASNADGHLYFHDAVGGTQGGVSYEHTGDVLRFRAGATNRASVGADGVTPGADATYKFGTAALRWTEGYVNQVLVAGADPTDAASAADDVVVGDGTGSRGISVFSASNADGHLYFHDAVGGTQGGVSYEHTGDVLRLRAGATNRASVGADGVTPEPTPRTSSVRPRSAGPRVTSTSSLLRGVRRPMPSPRLMTSSSATARVTSASRSSSRRPQASVASR